MTKRVMMKVIWSKVVNVRFTSAEPSKIKIKYKYQKDFIEADFCELKNVKKNLQLYKDAIGISRLKKDDLFKLCAKNLIPSHHQKFYMEIKVNSNKDDAEANEPKDKNTENHQSENQEECQVET